jgi:hypothetical protein
VQRFNKSNPLRINIYENEAGPTKLIKLHPSGESKVMPPSILKYIDVARLVGAGIKCPACNGTHCRQSRWHSKHEKLSAEGFRPYRCNDCTTRFLAPNGASLERNLINTTAGVLLCLGILTVGDLWLEYLDKPKISHAEAAPKTDSEQGATGAEARRQPEGEPSAARKDPPTPAEKLQKAAADGEVGAMLELGRELAAGDKLPKDPEQAAKWMQLAAATGNAEGMFELGRFYRDGLGLAQDPVRAYVWFSRAAAAKHPTALPERDQLVRTMSEEKLKEAHKLSLSEDPAADTVHPK